MHDGRRGCPHPHAYRTLPWARLGPHRSRSAAHGHGASSIWPACNAEVRTVTMHAALVQPARESMTAMLVAAARWAMDESCTACNHVVRLTERKAQLCQLLVRHAREHIQGQVPQTWCVLFQVQHLLAREGSGLPSALCGTHAHPSLAGPPDAPVKRQSNHSCAHTGRTWRKVPCTHREPCLNGSSVDGRSCHDGYLGGAPPSCMTPATPRKSSLCENLCSCHAPAHKGPFESTWAAHARANFENKSTMHLHENIHYNIIACATLQ